MKPLDYPLPSHAAYIWTNGSKILLTFPGYEGTESRRFNSVQLDPAETVKCKCGCVIKSPTLSTLWSILSSRANAKSDARKIASPATPTRHQLGEMVAAFRRTAKRTPKPTKADRLLEDLGITPETAAKLLESLK